MWAGIPAGDRSPYRSGIGGAYDVIPDGDVYYGSQVIDFSYGQSSPDLDDFYMDLDDFYIALYVLPDSDISSDYSRNIGDSYGFFYFL